MWIDSWYKNGVIYINDLIRENGYKQNSKQLIVQFKNQFCSISGNNTCNYAGRHSVIRLNKNLKLPFIPINIFLLIKSKKGGKDFYTILIRNNDKPIYKAINSD